VAHARRCGEPGQLDPDHEAALAHLRDGRQRRHRPEQAREQLEIYAKACAAHARPRGAAVIRRDVYVGESEAEAKATLDAAVAKGYRGFDPKALVAGSVAHVTERFRELNAMGFTDVIVRHLTTDHGKVLASFARLAEVRRALA
jgi:hypothetical protein